MGLPVTYVFTHDSIGLGEDGPTHQPIEQLAALRTIPGLVDLQVNGAAGAAYDAKDPKERARATAHHLERGTTCLLATLVTSPKQVAESSDVVFTIVGFPSDVRSVIFGSDGVLEGCCDGMVIVDMTTSQPSLAEEIAAAASARARRARKKLKSPGIGIGTDAIDGTDPGFVFVFLFNMRSSLYFQST